MKESIDSSVAVEEQALQAQLRQINGSLLAGLCRCIPKLAYPLSDSQWEQLCEDSQEFAHPDGGSFEILLFEAGDNTDSILGYDVESNMGSGRKALVRHQEADGAVSSSVIDLDDDNFAARNPGGFVNCNKSGDTTIVTITPGEGLKPQDTVESTCRFASNFVASTPEFAFPQANEQPTEVQVGTSAVAGAQVATAV